MDLRGHAHPVRDLLLEPSPGCEVATASRSGSFPRRRQYLSLPDTRIVLVQRVEGREDRPDLLRWRFDAYRVLEHSHEDTSFVGVFFVLDLRVPSCVAASRWVVCLTSAVRISVSSARRSRRSRRVNWRSAAVFGSYLALQPMISS